MNLNRQAGMTLIELMIGIVLLAILLALGAPTFFRWTQNSQIRNAAEAVQNGLTLARAEAVRRNTTVRFQLVTTTTAACALSATGVNWVVNVTSRRQMSGGRLRRSAFRQCRAAHRPGSFRRRRFPQRRRQWPWGIADHLQRHGPGNSGLAAIDVDNPTGGNCVTATPPGPMRCMRVRVATGGQIRMCDPARAADDPQGC